MLAGFSIISVSPGLWRSQWIDEDMGPPPGACVVLNQDQPLLGGGARRLGTVILGSQIEYLLWPLK